MPSRRELLGTLPVVALAGCVGRDESGAPTPEPDGTDTPTSTGSPTGTAGPTLAPDTVLLTVTDGDSEVDLLTVGDIDETGAVDESSSGAYVVPVELTPEGETGFEETLADVGALENPEAHEILTYLDGEVVFTASIAPGLADAVESGDWGGEFRLAVEAEATARRLRQRLP